MYVTSSDHTDILHSSLHMHVKWPLNLCVFSGESIVKMEGRQYAASASRERILRVIAGVSCQLTLNECVKIGVVKIKLVENSWPAETVTKLCQLAIIMKWECDFLIFRSLSMLSIGGSNPSLSASATVYSV